MPPVWENVRTSVNFTRQGALPMFRRRRFPLFVVATTVAAFVVGFMFAWGVLHSTPSAVERNIPSASAGGEFPFANEQPASETAERPAAVLDDDCDVSLGRFVGLHEGHVAIFVGSPDGCHKVVEADLHPESELLPFQRADLRRGIAFEDDEELFQILEGLIAP